MTPMPGAGISGIDTHAHIFRHDLPMAATRRYSPQYDALIEQYLAHLERNGLSHGVLIQPSFLGTDNHFMLDALRRHPQQLRGVAVVHPRITDAELDELGDAGVVGIRLNLVGKSLDDYEQPVWQALFMRLARRGWQVEIQRRFEDLDLIVPMILGSGVTLVVDHFGLPEAAPVAGKGWLTLLGNAPLWVKLSAPYRSQSDLARAQSLLTCLRESASGIDQLVWGSDWPHTQFEDQTDYTAQLAFFEALLPDAQERRQILVDNPARLFGFVRQGATS